MVRSNNELADLLGGAPIGKERWFKDNEGKSCQVSYFWKLTARPSLSKPSTLCVVETVADGDVIGLCRGVYVSPSGSVLLDFIDHDTVASAMSNCDWVREGCGFALDGIGYTIEFGSEQTSGTIELRNPGNSSLRNLELEAWKLAHRLSRAATDHGLQNCLKGWGRSADLSFVNPDLETALCAADPQSLRSMAETCVNEGGNILAEDLLRRTLDLNLQNRSSNLDCAHTAHRLAELYSIRADILFDQRSYGEAEQFLNRVLRIYVRFSEPESQSVAQILVRLGDIDKAQQKIRKAIQNYRRAGVLLIDTKPDHPILRVIEGKLAELT